jgi:hypothetical protein
MWAAGENVVAILRDKKRKRKSWQYAVGRQTINSKFKI